jgi:serine phosphatase RsbU (regulator of sigma subunit)
MPGMDGLSVLKAIHQIKPEIPVILISGIGGVRDVVEALRLGAADYLVKPLADIEVLVLAIHRALERTQLMKENLRYRQELERANKELREYVRLLERDHQAGRRLQTKLLPRRPIEVDTLKVTHRIFPSLYLSGDFIDYGFVSDRYLSFYLVDVSGHGAAPAFVTVWLKQLVRHYMRESAVFSDPNQFEQDSVRLLKLINRDVIKSQFDTHMTCFVGVIDTQTFEMRYVVGGHLPLPLLIIDGEARYLPGKGKPVGIFEDAEWEGEVIQLPRDKDFNIVVFSDGVLEILSETDLIDKENQLKALVTNTEVGLEGLSKVLKLNDGSSLQDDVAILHVSSEAK